MRELTGRTWGVRTDRRIDAINRFTVGWTAYFAFAEAERPFSDLDERPRRRLRQVRWKESKRGPTRARSLRSLGVPAGKAHESANTSKGPGGSQAPGSLNTTLTAAYWHARKKRFLDRYHRFRDATPTA